MQIIPPAFGLPLIEKANLKAGFRHESKLSGNQNEFPGEIIPVLFLKLQKFDLSCCIVDVPYDLKMNIQVG